MKKKKFLACLLAGAMVLSMAACGDNNSGTDEENNDPVVVQEDASIDFEDGNMGFVAPYMMPMYAAPVELSVADFNGSKALKVEYTREGVGYIPYVAIDATSLLGADVAKVASMEMTLGVSFADGSFNAVSGKIYAWSGEERVQTSDDWAVYLASANPKKAVATLSAGQEFVADAGNIFIISLEEDNGAAAGKGNATLYIDNIRFLDASGNLLGADSSVAFVQPEGFVPAPKEGTDMSNLAALTNAVEFEGFVTSGGEWVQNGLVMPQEILDALVPGAVVEIEYSSEDGSMWLVMPGASVGWSRVADGGGAYINNSHNIAQITYEQIAEVCGDDKSAWGDTMQCEAGTSWEVYSVRVGQAAPVYALSNAVEFEGFVTSGGEWVQNGLVMPQEILDALVPGSVVEIEYSSEDGSMWIVMPGASVGWSRVADGGASVRYDGKCYITYEQIAAVCGDDKSAWGDTMQCEAGTSWEVYSVRVGTANTMQMVNHVVDFEGFVTSGGEWVQNGLVMPQEILDALVPGAVVSIEYSSEDGSMWLVMPGASVGWSRVADGGKAACANGICQVTYEQIAEVCGDDISAWGDTMQCESGTNWEVYSVTVGQSPAGK